jgi:hypothetical protein
VDHEDYYDNHFKATQFMSWVTDWLPFSWWVRIFVMAPMYRATEKFGSQSQQIAIGAGNGNDTRKNEELPLTAAVLTGHFMFWAGPATSMYSRQFVPDWTTCCLIQPIGHAADIAVVLATWAGQSVDSRHQAEKGLYVFMMLMNVVSYFTRSSLNLLEHGIVIVLTFIMLVVRCAGFYAPFPEHEEVTTTTATLSPPLCATEHTNVKVVLETCAWVSYLAFVFHIFGVQIARPAVEIIKKSLSTAVEIIKNSFSTRIVAEEGHNVPS